MSFYIMDDKLPNWTDVVGALGAVATVLTLIKLLMRDKKRESEIASLSAIASQLKDMLEINEKRYLESKVPHIQVSLQKEPSLNEYVLNFTNINPNSKITNYSGKNVVGFSNNIKTSISDIGATQAFSFVVFIKEESFFITVTYIVDNKYLYTQDILIYKNNGTYEANPHRISYVGSEHSD